MSDLYKFGIFLVVIVGTHFYAYQKGIAHRKAQEAGVTVAVLQAREEASKGAAEAIAKIEIKNTTVYQKVQHEISTNTVYRECAHNDVGMQLVNEALSAPNSTRNTELP